MAGLSELFAQPFFGNIVGDYVLALGVFVALSIVFRLFKFAIIGRLKQFSEKTSTGLDDLLVTIVDGIRWPFYLIVALWIGMQFIVVPGVVSSILFYVVLISAGYYTVKALTKIVDYGAQRYTEEREKEEKGADTSIVDLLTNILKLTIWVFAIFLVLTNAGIDITPMIAGLGIGGVALAFGFQSILKDVFAAFSIYFDKPFRKGDYIVVGSDSGTVHKIGIKSTRIKTLQGQELIISNRELTDSRVNNFKKMTKRRVSFEIGVTYETPTAKLKKINGIIEKIIKSVENVEFSRCHFKAFGDFSLNFSIVYYVTTRDYVKYADAHQKINFKIKQAFEKEKIEFAYPTQLVYTKKG